MNKEDLYFNYIIYILKSNCSLYCKHVLPSDYNEDNNLLNDNNISNNSSNNNDNSSNEYINE